MAKAVELSKGRGLDAMSRIASEYAALAGDPSALSARKLLLATLFSEKDISLKLSGVLAAVEADPTPPEKDPLWEQISKQISELWKGDIATKGMDLVMAESRPRARRVLISSFVDLATSERLGELTPDQKQTLTETMVDVTPHVAPGQKREVDRALRALGGNDLADIMAGKGLTGKDGHVLESERAYNEALEQTKKDLEAKGQADAP
jgi:BMFP domain-containing protein YqiC